MPNANEFMIGIDDGHGILNANGTGENPGKRTPLYPDGHYVLEDMFNKPVAIKYENALKRCGFRTVQLAPEDINVPLNTRTLRARQAGCNATVSWHYNAFRGIWNESKGGQSIYIYPGREDSYRFAQCVLEFLIQGTSQINKGILTGDFAVVRDTKCPAILIESGFMDVTVEANRMTDDNYQIEQAEQACMGTCKFFNVLYKQPVPQVITWQVYVNGNRYGSQYQTEQEANVQAEVIYQSVAPGNRVQVGKMLNGSYVGTYYIKTKPVEAIPTPVQPIPVPPMQVPVNIPEPQMPTWRLNRMQGIEKHNLKTNLPEG